jgi:preprotein translocase subunit SecF
MDIVGKRRIFLSISGIVTLISIVSIVLFGFKLSIEFTGGSKTEIASTNSKVIDIEKAKKAFSDNKIKVVTVTKNSKEDVTFRTDTITDAQKNKVISDINQNGQEVIEKSFNTLGPVIGGEAETDAVKAVIIAIIAITLYIAFAFRQVSRPVSSWKFGISAIIALIHDVLIVAGAFSLFGLFFGVEIDTLFITAVLTIMGFSVHDTIVVFDRIRENLVKNIKNSSFEEVVNLSFNETLARSLNTSLTVVLVLLALLLFGGESIRWFITAFLIGIIIGTYSSIFIASALIVEWNNFDKKEIKISDLKKKLSFSRILKNTQK